MIDKLRKHQFKFLNYLFEDMYPVKSKYYPDSTFFKKDDKVTLELEKSGTLWVLYSVWTDIADMFSLDYNETQQLIKAWMEQQIKRKGVVPHKGLALEFVQMEQQIKSEEVTPRYCFSEYYSRMEQQLKSEEVTPILTIWNYEEVIPHTCITNQLMRVREELESVEITPEESIPLQSWRDLEKKEITPRSAMAPPFRWRELDSVKYAEIKPTISTSYRLEEKIKSEEITPRQVVNGSFDWVQEQIIPEKTTCFIDSVRWKKMND